jgi:hypothetical protein
MLLRTPSLRQPAAVEAAYAAIVLGKVKIITGPTSKSPPCSR